MEGSAGAIASGRESDKSRRTGFFLHVELLQFFLLARSSQLYERCNPVNKFNGSPGGTEMIHTESPGNFVVIFEILPTDKK